jgi:hypothetical protein
MSAESKRLAEQMMAAYREPFATDHDPRELLRMGATEILKLCAVVDDYAAICQASSNEIRRLRDER